MSYCIKCGVELSDYMIKCPLCNTKVIRPDEESVVPNTDYPDYRISPRSETKRVNKLFVGRLLTMLFFNYAALTLVINLLVNNEVSWSLIPILSLVLTWIAVAYPFFRKRNSFFVLYSIDSGAVIVYLLALNFIISQNFAWSKYAALGIFLLWVILTGFFLTEKIKHVLPIAVYYILASVVFFVVTTLFVESKTLELQLVFPITVLILIISLVSYFIIVARANDALGMTSVILMDVSIFCLALDIMISYFVHNSLMPTWSLYVNAVTIPIFATLHTIKRGRQLKAIISKKLHR